MGDGQHTTTPSYGRPRRHVMTQRGAGITTSWVGDGWRTTHNNAKSWRTTSPRHDTEEGISEVGGPKGRSLGPGVFFLILFLSDFINIHLHRDSIDTRTHPRYNSESVGRFCHLQTPPSLQARVGGITRHTDHPRYNRESVGSYVVLYMRNRPKRTSFGPK
jgi:hypothetical protein